MATSATHEQPEPARPVALWNVFSAVAGAVPDRDAIVFDGHRRSYRELLARSHDLAAFLVERGLGSRRARSTLDAWEVGQDVVLVYLSNGPEYLEACLGAFAARSIPANVNYRYVATEVEYLLRDCAPRVVIYHVRFGTVLRAALTTTSISPILVHVDDGSGEPPIAGSIAYEEIVSGGSPTTVGSTCSPDDIYMLYTGGTTGMPKGVLWRQADIYEVALGGSDRLAHDARSLGMEAGLTEPRAVLPVAPFMHGAAQWVALRALLRGDTVVVNTASDRLDGDEVWTLVEREQVRTMLMIGEAFARPLISSLEQGDYDIGSLHTVLLGGAFTSPDTKRTLIELMPEVAIADLAGASETGTALTAISSGTAVAAAGVFRTQPGTVVLDGARRSVLAADSTEVGWLARAGHIPLGYLNDPVKTAATFPTVDGVRYVVPGDRAERLPDGTLRLLGRDSATINSGGEKIYAEEVEQALILVPGIQDAVVVGRPSERWGQEVVAVIAVDEHFTQSDSDVNARLQGIARYKRPKAIVRVPALRRSPAGKADYQWARTLVEGRRDA